MPSIFLAAVPNRFSLAVPSAAWLQPIADYDPDLRIFPSQTQPCYRLMRVARYSGGMSAKTFLHIPGIHPDTKVALEQRLVAVTTIPPMALQAPPENIVRQLQGRDQWAIGGGQDGTAADRVADRLDQRDAQNTAALRQEVRDDGLPIHQAARISLLYRTGARVSLVRPPTWARPAADTSPSGSPPPAGAPAPGFTPP